jgi:DNA-binding NtrC family response regulator
MYTQKNLSVFVIDDSPALTEMLKDFIEKKHPGAQISVFKNGEEAIPEIYRNPNIIILDYYLDSEKPDAMNGLQVLKKIKEENSEMPVVILSAQDKTEVSANTIKFGAYDYIVKNESAFDKVEIILNNIIAKQKLTKNLGTQTFFNWLLLILLVVIIAAFLYTKYMP